MRKRTPGSAAFCMVFKATCMALMPASWAFASLVGAQPEQSTAAIRILGREAAFDHLLHGLFFFGVSFTLAFIVSRGRGAMRVPLDTQVSAKEAATTTAILRACARNMTPGILLSPEFETCKNFRFAVLQGRQLSVDVQDVSEQDRAALRLGLQVCAQFVHDAGTVICMMIVLRTQQLSPRRMRVTFTAPLRLAQQRHTVPAKSAK